MTVAVMHSSDALLKAIAAQARSASIELNVPDAPELEEGRRYLAAGTKVYISHLPRQRWDDTLALCRATAALDLDPVPHIPVRLLDSPQSLQRLIDSLVTQAHVREVLLIAGDDAEACGPYRTVLEVLRTVRLGDHGLRAVSFAGHPEGHPVVDAATIRQAEVEKTLVAAQQGLQVTLLTQFFFEAEPFIRWTEELRARGIEARLVAGLAGPARLATLLKLAIRCGVGASLRALRSGPTTQLLSDYEPERLVETLVAAQLRGTRFDGFHFFCFGGFARTCRWLHRLAARAPTLATP